MSSEKVSLKQLAEGLDAEFFGNDAADLADVTHDSRQVREGTVFVAIKGATADGHRYLDDVVRRGTAGIISENAPPEGFDIGWLRVSNARAALAKAVVHANPP